MQIQVIFNTKSKETKYISKANKRKNLRPGPVAMNCVEKKRKSHEKRKEKNHNKSMKNQLVMAIRELKNDFLRKFCHEQIFSWQPDSALDLPSQTKTVTFISPIKPKFRRKKIHLFI